MNPYDGIEAVYYLKRNRKGKIVGKELLAPEEYRFLVNRDGMIPDPSFPVCQVLERGMPSCLLTMHDIEIQRKQGATHEL